MTFTRFAHVAFQVRDLDRALSFYRDGLGLREHFRITFRELRELKRAAAEPGSPHGDSEAVLTYIDEHLDDPWLLYLEIAPLQFLELFPAIDPAQLGDPLGNDSHAHFCLQVDDIDAAAAEAARRGLDPGPVSWGPDHSAQFWLTDPDGHRIELMQYSDISLQVRRMVH